MEKALILKVIFWSASILALLSCKTTKVDNPSKRMVAIIAVPVMSREQLTNEVTQLKALNKELMEGYLLLQQSNVELNEKLLRLDSAYFIIKDGMATFQDSVFFKMISVERLRVGTLQPLHGDTLRVTP